ncbi:MAG: penicillin acylase family protein [Promethearchaeota archaeon]
MEEFLNVAKNAFPPVSGTEKLKGLKEEVEILWDKWGIPHIYAKSQNDAYFAQGYVHASHRLWQLEFLRKVSSGTLSELVGKATLDRDKHYRIIGLHRIAKKNAESFAKDPNNEIYQGLLSYVKGVNAGIEKAKKNPPLEFHVLNLELNEWKLEDTFKVGSLIEWGLSSWNYPLEILREHLILKLGPELADKLIPLYSSTDIQEPKGSNSWAVKPNKSNSGAVLLASDPHLTLTLPSIWFFVHLNCTELNVMGVSFPGMPGILIGHNEKIAWGMTNASADTTDLFKLEINPDNNNQYRYAGEWVDFNIIDEPIKVSGKSKPIPFNVKFSKFGPIVEYIELTTHVHKIKLPETYALRWASFDANIKDTYESFMKVNKASNWQEFLIGLDKLPINPQNFIYGDINGNIGHQQGGKVPIRKYGNGATVTPGTGDKFNWLDLAPSKKLFSIYNPEHGFVYNANYNENKAPNGVLIAQDGVNPYRQIRIKNLLQSKENFSTEDFKDFQLDYFTEEGRELLPKMLKTIKLKVKSQKNKEIISLLKNWDYLLTKDSVAGTIYKIWCQETLRVILIPFIGEELFNVFLESSPFDLQRLFKLYQDKTDELATILLKALENTIQFLLEKISPDFRKWKWGNLHRVILAHPFSQANKAAEILNIGPFKIGGDSNTLNNGYYNPLSNYYQSVGPSSRQIHDLIDWNKSVGALPGGQSGLPFHKHYNDLMKLWARGKYISLLFTRKAILENIEGILKLIPK